MFEENPPRRGVPDVGRSCRGQLAARRAGEHRRPFQSLKMSPSFWFPKSSFLTHISSLEDRSRSCAGTHSCLVPISGLVLPPMLGHPCPAPSLEEDQSLSLPPNHGPTPHLPCPGRSLPSNQHSIASLHGYFGTSKAGRLQHRVQKRSPGITETFCH